MESNEWISVEITIANEQADPAAHFCHGQGSSGVVIEEPSPGLTLIRAYFPVFQSHEALPKIKSYIEDLHRNFPNLSKPSVRSVPVKTENWATMWKERFRPMHVGKRLVVSPPWIQPDHQGKEIVFIEPAAAFGTGTHETTQGCLILLQEALDQAMSVEEDWTMLDVGCGSGILAIAAVKLGLKRITAVDNDPIAVDAARKNAELNNTGDQITFQCISLDGLTRSWDLVTANLDPRTLFENKVNILNLLKRYLIISGVPLEQWDDVKAEFQRGKLKLVKEVTKSEWGCGFFTC